MNTNYFSQKMLIGATILTVLASSCNNVPKSKIETKTEAKTENTSEIANKGREVSVTYLSATWYAGSTKYLFKNTKGEEIEISLLNDPAEAKDYNPKMPTASLLEDDDPNREGPPSENPKFVGKKFKLIYDAKDKIVEIRKDF